MDYTSLNLNAANLKTELNKHYNSLRPALKNRFICLSVDFSGGENISFSNFNSMIGATTSEILLNEYSKILGEMISLYFCHRFIFVQALVLQSCYPVFSQQTYHQT